MERNERLTARSATVSGEYDIYFERLDDGIFRLGRYEDTGLSPDEINELKYLHEKLQDYEVSRNAQLVEELAFEKGRTKALVHQIEELKSRLDKQIRMNEELVSHLGKNEPVTHYDNIKNLSAEEFAAFLFHKIPMESLDFCKDKDCRDRVEDGECYPMKDRCIDCLTCWLNGCADTQIFADGAAEGNDCVQCTVPALPGG